MIEVQSLSKKFADQWALKENTWSVQEGRSLGLLGPNGAGKSTTMKIMTGLLCSTEGHVKIDGFDILKEPVEAKKRIGYLPETPPLYEELKVVDYLRFICGLKSVPKNQWEEQIDQAIAKMTLNEVAYRPIRVLSKGFRQRVGISQTLIGEPKILILDEPSVGLDPHQVYELREIIKSLKKHHIIVLSTHILSEVQQICDDVVILDKGVVKAKGSLNELLKARQATHLVEIQVQKSTDELLKNLEKLPAVNQVQLNQSTLQLHLLEEGVHNLDLYLSEIIKHKCGVQSVTQKHQQLEDVFIEVTR